MSVTGEDTAVLAELYWGALPLLALHPFTTEFLETPS